MFLYLKNNNKIIDIVLYILLLLFFLAYIIWFVKYISYISSVVRFPFEWEPTDGDHLSFAHRIFRGLPIYKNMKDGDVLSIYNPAYYYLLALFGKNSSFSLARFLSAFFWLSSPVIILVSYREKWGLLLSILASVLILIPFSHGLEMELVNIGPTSLMILLFVLSLIYLDYIITQDKLTNFSLILSAFLFVLCYFSKQQGIVASFIGLITLIVNKRPFKKILLFIIAGLFFFFVLTLYVEMHNSYSFLNDTIWDLRKIMPYDRTVAYGRINCFIQQNINYIIFSFISIVFILFTRKKISVWFVSILVHSPFLVLILGNGGGGNNYWESFWISVIMLIFETLSGLKTRRNGIILIVLFFLFLNSKDALISNYSDLSKVAFPNISQMKMMKHYYSGIAKMVKEENPKTILTNRNTGAFVAAGLVNENEGCTMFSYAWYHPLVFNKQPVLSNVKNKRYDLILTGIQEFPKDLQNEISKNYYISEENRTNFLYGRIGVQKIWKPKNLLCQERCRCAKKANPM